MSGLFFWKFVLNKKIGDAVKKGETLLTVHYRPKQDSLVEEIAKSILTKDIEIKKTKPTKKKLIQEVKVKMTIGDDGLPVFSWDKVKDADYYYVVSLDYSNEKGYNNQQI